HCPGLKSRVTISAIPTGLGNSPQISAIGTADIVSMEFIPSSNKLQAQKTGIKIPGYNFGHPYGIGTFATDQCHRHDRYCIDGIYSIDYNNKLFC
ncbi:MAG: hypothetical protein Q8O72_17980, partial [Bacteroidales bacterium]|nr:hypothetical protein [Bacteroidales bacterium]